MAEMAHIFQEERREESPIHAQNEAAENNNAIDLHDEVASGNGNSHDTVMVIDHEDGDYGGVMEGEANEEVGSNSDNGKAVERRPRSQFRWTKEMHHYFVSIVDMIGGPESK